MERYQTSFEVFEELHEKLGLYAQLLLIKKILETHFDYTNDANTERNPKTTQEH
jgi:hypothetical protein